MNEDGAHARQGEEPKVPRAGGEVVDWTEITLTAQCNQRCFFCYEEARGNAERPGMDHVLELLHQTKEHADQVVLCGKEFLLRPDAVEIVAAASKLGLRTVVFTNGQALARKGLVARLDEAGCSGIALSFHFPDREIFGRAARVASRLFDRVVDGMTALGDHNRECSHGGISVSTETDMFAMNVGRLEEMRQTLMSALGTTSWSMRLASLLPARIHDIGIEHVLDPLDERREEIAAFVKSHPEGIPLAFVKVPLCIVPEGMEHLSLDARYVYEGTVLTFNHAESKRITVDTISSSSGRDVKKLMDRHPYRWACRSCAMAAICRFERVDWQVEGFLPTRDQRPLPYRPKDATPAAVDRLPMKFRRSGALDVLAPLGPVEAVAGRIQSMLSTVCEPYPEEEIIEALASCNENEPALVDAWADHVPVLAMELRVGEEQVSLRIEAARPDTELGAVVGNLVAHPLNADESSPAFLECARLLARLPLPSTERWANTPGFDLGLSRLLERAWQAMGEMLWAGTSTASFSTRRARIDPSKCLALDLELACGGEAGLVLWLSEDGADLMANIECDAAADERGLARALAEQVPELVLPRRLRENMRAPLGDGGVLRAEAFSPATPELRYAFRIAGYQANRSYYKRVNDVVLWYSHESNDRSAATLCKLLLRVMKSMTTPTPATFPAWQEAILEESARAGLGGRVEWAIEWEPDNR